MENSIVAHHAYGKGKEGDMVFIMSKRANDAIAEYGKERVINSTIGAIYDEEGNFAAFKTLSDHYRKMPDEELMNYPPISGVPAFLEAAIDYTFGNYRPDGAFIRAVATPGGSGAVRHVFFNYLEERQKALIPDWFWGPYRTIAYENLRDVETYRMFDEENQFTLASMKEKTLELLKVQDRLVIVFNTPAHNPSGYSMNMEEWREALGFLIGCVKDKTKKIVILLDLAYIDYVGTCDEGRSFMKLFGGLPENILVTMAFSMSKSFLVYGMRSGALIGVSSSSIIAEEFFRVNTYSNRGVWSTGTMGAQKLLVDIIKNHELQNSISIEREAYTNLILRRAELFVQEAREIGLAILPYHGGFFISVPTEDPLGVADRLMKENIFIVPLKKGLRVAVCALPTVRIAGLALMIKTAM